jgi:hypothetical protein
VRQIRVPSRDQRGLSSVWPEVRTILSRRETGPARRQGAARSPSLFTNTSQQLMGEKAGW